MLADVCDKGVIYVARGPSYFDLAVASAQSLREMNPGFSVDIFTDQPVPPGSPATALFDQVHPLPDGPARAKIVCLAMSRFARTLYLDCDTLVVKPFGDLFDILHRFELAVAHDMRRISPLIREHHAERTPYAFPQLNCGVLLFRRSAASDAFFAEWSRRYLEAGKARDQVTFKDLIWSSDIRFYVLPPEFNLRRVTMMDAWEPLDALPTIIHSHRLLDHLRGTDAPRVRTLAEILRLERKALQREWLTRGLPASATPDENPSQRFRDLDEVPVTSPIRPVPGSSGRR